MDDAARYVVRVHGDHWHVVDTATDHGEPLTDSPANPWRYSLEELAHGAAARLNAAVRA